MTELQALKEECSKKEKIVEELNEKLCQKIILRDLNILQPSDSSITSGSDKNKFFKDKLIITVTSAGMLEIEDRRDSAFLWVFEVLLDNAIRIGNAFEFDNAISTLKSDISLDAWTYKYYDCHEEVTCKSIQDVFSTILKRQH